MPNHVSMDLWVVGKKDTLDEFQEFAKQDDNVLSADKFIPYPSQYKEMDRIAEEVRSKLNPGDSWENVPKDGFNSGGYEWCIDNWGTKWGIYGDELVKSTKNSLKYHCESAWSPPLPVIKSMSKKFPTLKFKLKYYEMGAQFKGTFLVKNGDILENIVSKYNGNRGG